MSSKANMRAKLAELKAARESGKRNYKVEDDDQIFDTVTEEDYKLVVSDRLARDDFIEEDNGVSGYADNGEDHWDNRVQDEDMSSSDDDNEKEAARKAKRKAKEEKEKQRLKAAEQRRKLKQIVPDGHNPYIKPKKDEAEADDFMASLIGGLDTPDIKPSITTTPAQKQRSVAVKPIKSALSGFKRRADDDGSVLTATRSPQAAHSSSDAYSSDAMPGMDPSSDGLDTSILSTKKTRFHDDEDDDILDHNLGDVDKKMNLQSDADAMDVDQKPNINRGDEDDEEDDVFLKPKAPLGKPKSAVRRQLVNAGSVKPASPSIVKDETDSKLLADDLPVSTNGKPKAKGTDWKLATSELAVATGALFEEDNMAMDEAEPLPIPESLKRKGKRAPPVVVPTVNALEQDGSVKFWWFDYVEPPNSGKLILVGKVRARGGKDDGRWVSACVQVTGIKRKLYVLPRKTALDDEGNELEYDEDEGEGLEFDDVAMDVETKFEEEYGVTGIEITPEFVRRKYAFGIKGIPREETDWLELKCDFPKPPSRGEEPRDIPLDASGERFSHVFGTKNSAFELFVVERKIMGPCWLNIKAPQVKNNGISWTRLELEASKDDVELFDQDDATAPKAAPPLTVMSLSMRTVVHLNDNKRELVCASARIWNDCNIDDTTPIAQQPSRATTLVRNLFTPFPTGFEELARKNSKPGDAIVITKDEDALLQQLLGLFFRHDPDVIVGHDFIAADLDVIIKRMQHSMTDNWSQLGRFRRDRWPKTMAGRNGGILNGRLILDLNCDGSRSIIDSQTWTLTEMCSTHLRIAREDIDLEDTPKFFDNVHSTAKHLLHFVSHCLADTYLQMAVAFKVQALPLTRQLTNLAGNSWNKTLQGQRAERNEYILLHRFNEHGYVVPDKISKWDLQREEARKTKKGKVKAAHSSADNDEEGADDETKPAKATKVSMTKKKYAGGLVFEPEKGLFDRYVLVMDFNSLYPSIIQEYDIDFSTIDWTVDGAEEIEKMPERMPCEGEPQGILPQLIASLVARRRQVKSLMKDKGLSAGRYQQYEIAQKALKLTANSMYGCLGFEGSRFYALPLAALTTFKGREILTRTKADAENLDLKVIYGDTDSIFINTNQSERAAAIRIGNEFKKSINEKYRKLEIDTDAVFERILLLNKKKYAARKVEDDGTITTEIKGLDMKRREYCELSKNTSEFVLDKILSGQATETVVEQIHDYLTQLGQDVRAGRIKQEQFVIIKRLGKNPQDYPDAKSLPHVQVALRMKARGQNAKALDVIPYIFCLPANKESAKSGKAENAYHPDEVRKNNLVVDVEVYLHAQVLPPIERLCDPIAGTEKARLAECLGLDVSRYFGSSGDLPEHHFKTLNSQISDAVRFKDACSPGQTLTKSGMFCTNIECLEPLSVASVAVQLDLQIRQHVSKFYEGWIVCDEPTCGNRTRMMSVYGRVCLMPGCKGQVQFEYSDGQLYAQLLYFDTLFDVERVRSKLFANGSPETRDILDAQNATLNQLRSVVTKHLEKNGRRWVSMSSLFSFMTTMRGSGGRIKLA
ncbi:DNA-directed DNA polymerase alpha catalytic subunit pol1 [Microbotryomycetes sp. JL221]|nr:DNA-directed DNA polymerase alpha catalytic subunit pol1 [Microbotryomycetes sp. JL221]